MREMIPPLGVIKLSRMEEKPVCFHRESHSALCRICHKQLLLLFSFVGQHTLVMDRERHGQVRVTAISCYAGELCSTRTGAEFT